LKANNDGDVVRSLKGMATNKNYGEFALDVSDVYSSLINLPHHCFHATEKEICDLVECLSEKPHLGRPVQLFDLLVVIYALNLLPFFSRRDLRAFLRNVVSVTETMNAMTDHEPINDQKYATLLCQSADYIREKQQFSALFDYCCVNESTASSKKVALHIQQLLKQGGTSVEATIIQESSVDQVESCAAYEPMKASEWSYVPPGPLNRCSLWSHTKKTIGLVKYDQCFEQISQLTRKAREENWGPGNEVLISYLDHTFRRCTEENKVLGLWIPYTRATEDYHVEEREILDEVEGLSSTEKNKLDSWCPPLLSSDRAMAACILIWNTGLVTSAAQDIYGIMIPYLPSETNIVQTPPIRWHLKWFSSRAEFSQRKRFESSLGQQFSEIVKRIHPPQENHEGHMIKIADLNVPLVSSDELPTINNYFEGAPVEVFQFDPKLQIDWHNSDQEHLFEHIERCGGFEELERGRDSFLRRLESGLKLSVVQAQRNRRLAVPFFARHSGKAEMQLMLPINLDYQNSERVDCALVLGLKNESLDPEKPTYKYDIRTIFSLKQAYNNARLISAVDSSWLSSAMASDPVPQQSKVTKKQIRSNTSAPSSNNSSPLSNASIEDEIFQPMVAKQLYTDSQLRETISAIQQGKMNFRSGVEFSTKTGISLAEAIIEMKPNWKASMCKHAGSSHPSYKDHGRKPHACAYAHSSEEIQYWNEIRENKRVKVTSKTRTQ